MARETRRRGSRYYTRSVLVNGVGRRQYFGKDDLAHLVASVDEADHLAQKAQVEAWRLENTAVLEQEAPLIPRMAKVPPFCEGEVRLDSCCNHR